MPNRSVPPRSCRRLLLPAALLSLGAPSAAAQVPLQLAPASRITFAGTSTVRSWSCDVTAPEATIDATSRALGAATRGGERVVQRVRLRIPVSTLDCRNGTMNGHMRKALEADAHPTIEFVLGTYEVDGSAAARTGTLVGTLSIRGTARPVRIPVTFVPEGEDALRVRGEHVVTMPEFAVKPPTLMLGTMKVGADVTVRFDLLVTPR
jgi:polyisoprenoid-binding protein YceI